MSKRRYGRARRKQWGCGHRGWGDECHRCALADQIDAALNPSARRRGVLLPAAYVKLDANGEPQWAEQQLVDEARRLRAGDMQPVLERSYRKSTAAIAAAFSVLLLALLGHGCATTGSVGGGRVDWPSAVSCAQPVASDAIGSVTSVLLGDGGSSTISDRAVSELERLARTHTPTVIACLVDELVRGWSQPGAAAHPERVAATQRGRDFLDRVAGTSVIRREVEP